MLKWIDRDTFILETKYCIYSYNNLVYIGIFTSCENETKLVIKYSNGDKIILYSCPSSDEDKVKKLKEDFNSFYKSRPGNNEVNKIKIK